MQERPYFELDHTINMVPIGALGAETNQGTSSAPVTPPQPDPQGHLILRSHWLSLFRQ